MENSEKAKKLRNLSALENFDGSSAYLKLLQNMEMHKKEGCLQIHTEKNPYRCNLCNLSFARKTRLEISTQLRTLSPKAVMKRGFTLTSTLDGRIITHAKLVKENDFLKLQWQDDSHTIRIESENDK